MKETTKPQQAGERTQTIAELSEEQHEQWKKDQAAIVADMIGKMLEIEQVDYENISDRMDENQKLKFPEDRRADGFHAIYAYQCKSENRVKDLKAALQAIQRI